MQVSVVVPVYNAERTIGACLDSLLAQDVPADAFEIIAVDNASTDGTDAVLRRYDGRVRVVQETTRGPAAARNTGVRAAAGSIVAFTDADCTAERDWLRQLVEPLTMPPLPPVEERAGSSSTAGKGCIGIVGGRILSQQPCNPVEAFGETIHDHRMAIETYRPPYVITMNWASPRRCLLEAGLFDESYIRCEDVDLSQRILGLGYRLVYQHGAVVRHRNERTLRGLFREGFQHGVWAVKHNRQNHETHAQSGHRRFVPAQYLAIGGNLVKALTGPNRLPALCQGVFDAGKKCGKAAGSVRFGYLDL